MNRLQIFLLFLITSFLCTSLSAKLPRSWKDDRVSVITASRGLIVYRFHSDRSNCRQISCLQKSINNACSICLQNMTLDQWLVVLDCDHTFHRSCISEISNKLYNDGCQKWACPEALCNVFSEVFYQTILRDHISFRIEYEDD